MTGSLQRIATAARRFTDGRLRQAGDATRLLAAGRRLMVDIVYEHRLVLIAAGAYIVVGGAVLTHYRRPWPLTLVTGTFATVWALASAIWLFLQYLIHPRLLRAALAPRRIGGAVVVFLLMTPFQMTFQALKRSIGIIHGFRWDERLSNWDIALHGRAPWKWLEPMLASDGLTKVVDLVYVSWFPIFVALVAWMSWSGRRALRMRVLLAFLILWIVFGTAGGWAWSSAGPCYYGFVVGEPNPYHELLQRLDTHGNIDARGIQGWLWDVQQSDTTADFAGVSAMPSMHVAMAVFYAVVGWQGGAVLGIALSTYALITQIGSVLLGWHYAIDGYVGSICTGIAWWLAGLLVQRTSTDGDPRSLDRPFNSSR